MPINIHLINFIGIFVFIIDFYGELGCVKICLGLVVFIACLRFDFGMDFSLLNYWGFLWVLWIFVDLDSISILINVIFYGLC